MIELKEEGEQSNAATAGPSTIGLSRFWSFIVKTTLFFQGAIEEYGRAGAYRVGEQGTVHREEVRRLVDIVSIPCPCSLLAWRVLARRHPLAVTAKLEADDGPAEGSFLRIFAGRRGLAASYRQLECHDPYPPDQSFQDSSSGTFLKCGGRSGPVAQSSEHDDVFAPFREAVAVAVAALCWTIPGITGS